MVKKSAALLLTFILSMTMLSGLSHAETVPKPLSAGEARQTLQMWLNGHPFQPPAILARGNKEYSHNNSAYYLFSLADAQRYWLNFLVHKDTGNLFFMMISDGEETVIEIEPLNDWYNKHY